MSLKEIFLKLQLSSTKWSSYFDVYERLFAPYRGKRPIFVEIGVLNGGSLEMWKTYFGSGSRVIGVDLNPDVTKLRDQGFEVYSGNQGSPDFWKGFFDQIGQVDIVLDDGAHTNAAQMVTAQSVVPFTKDGGMLVVEDTHASYMPEFGNPHRYSFMEFAKTTVDALTERNPRVKSSHQNPLANHVIGMEFYESIVVFRVDRQKVEVPEIVTSGRDGIGARDYRIKEMESRPLYRVLDAILSLFLSKRRVRRALGTVRSRHVWLLNFRNRRFFKSRAPK
jgi:hypothetical protein